MKKSAFSLLSLAALVALCSCVRDREPGSNTRRISVAGIAASNLPPSEKSEEIAKAAEELLNGQGFSEAHEASVEALKQDPNNLRAAFIKTITAPLLEQKGIFARVKPLSDRDPKSREEHDREVAKLAKKVPEKVFKFLTEGPADIKTEEQLQAHLDSSIRSLDELRAFAKKNKDNELTVKASSILIPNMIERYANACEIKTTAALEYELICPDPKTRHHVTLNRADFESIQNMASYFKIYLSILNAYSLAGTIDTGIASAKGPKKTAQQIADELLQAVDFGRLREKTARENFLAIKNMGLDMVAGLNWAMSHQDTLCPAGQETPRNRVGMLMNKGLCFPSVMSPYVTMLSNLFEGKPVELKTARYGKSYVTETTAMAFFAQPPTDLRKLGPWQFNKCDYLSGLGDATMAGIFPKGDVNTVLQHAFKDCEP